MTTVYDFAQGMLREYSTFAGQCAAIAAAPGAEETAAELYSMEDLPMIAARLRDFCTRAESAEVALAAARAEVARLRAVIGDAAVELPVWPEGAYQTPTERDVSAVRAGLYAALGVTR